MNTALTLAAVAMLLALLSGCTSISGPYPVPPDRCWTDHDQLDERIRFYPRADEKQVLNATQEKASSLQPVPTRWGSTPSGVALTICLA